MVKRIIYYFCSLFVSTAAVFAQQKTDLTVFVKPNIGAVRAQMEAMGTSQAGKLWGTMIGMGQ